MGDRVGSFHVYVWQPECLLSGLLSEHLLFYQVVLNQPDGGIAQKYHSTGFCYADLFRFSANIYHFRITIFIGMTQADGVFFHRRLYLVS